MGKELKSLVLKISLVKSPSDHDTSINVDSHWRIYQEVACEKNAIATRYKVLTNNLVVLLGEGLEASVCWSVRASDVTAGLWGWPVRIPGDRQSRPAIS